MRLYIDPGTGSMLFTILIGMISAGVYFFRDQMVKIRFWLSGGRTEKNTGDNPDFVIFSDSKRYWNVFEPICDEFEKNGLAEKVWQFFIAIPDIKSVGVKDDSRYEGWPAIIRAVNTKDAMTATIEEIPYPVLHKVTARITSEVEGINRVLYDLTPKPTGTIEWE